MIRLKTKAATATLIALSLVSSVFGQQTTAPAQPAAPAQRGPDYVDFTGFKGKVFDVKHRDPRTLVQALSALGSGFKGATVNYSNEFKTITVRDFPENIAAIEEALKRLDTPQPAQSDIELRMNVLLASNVEGVTAQVPADISDVVKQLQATLNYKSYSNIATIIQRVKNGSQFLNGKGTAEVPAQITGAPQVLMAGYGYDIRSIIFTPDATGASVAQLENISFHLEGPGPVGSANIQTSLSVRGGEKVVVGTATLGNKGLILVLSARPGK
jgi:hypothetical protein